MIAGVWGKHKYIGMQLEGKTLGVIGLGRVGSHVARIAKGIGMRVIYYDPFVFSDEYEKVSLQELLQISDIVTLHTPHTKLTDALINESTLKFMKKTAYLINCARGKVVDESALIHALKAKHIAGAALDVFEKEPLGDTELTVLENVILTPHIGGSTGEAQRATGIEVAEGVLSILRGGRPTNLLNPEIDLPKVKYFEGISTIIFDCDSTLVSIEGIDELARLKGVEKQIIPLTEQAMNGELAPEDVFKKRLEIIKPTKQELLELGQLYIKHLLPGTKDIIMRLKNQGIKIYIVSGGYDLPLHILADYLDIPRRNVHANIIHFTKNGEYAGLDESIPLWKKCGKEIDGVTDAEAKDAVDIFIGFGGVKKRDAVKKEAHIYLETPTLAPLLHIANENGCRHNLMTIAEREFLILGLDNILNPDMATFMFDDHKAEIVQQLLT
jgi:HAD superfamily phosphoserine phosphatase-like hydrolase